MLPMVTDVYQMLAEESSVAKPQKVPKINGKSEFLKFSWQLCFRLYRLIPWVSSANHR
jgi:hypothetical protein